ncbi:MAG: nucleotidyltransferase family protein [Candidatus Sericytochromatia bacterium]|nr:nucleotidyltransferase family protein [Candidatus Sericytochromatia bacterium]
MPAHIAIDQQAIADFCRKWHVTELALFGSVLRDDFRPESDVDVLVTFDESYSPGWFIVTMEDELAAMFGRKVDLITKKALYHRIRDGVLAEAEVQFAA